jgi:hypothetical protein
MSKRNQATAFWPPPSFRIPALTLPAFSAMLCCAGVTVEKGAGAEM